ncbi:MAG: hypothetical protein ACI4TH_06390, partial [Candidatus Ornithomonoglobus sp.]
TAVVYDAAGQAMPAEEIEWSIDNIKTGLTGVSIENGIVTVTSDMPIVDNNGDELIIRAACKSDSTVTSTVTLHVYNVAEISDFDITGPAIIKDGTTIAYGVTDVKDQYGVAMTTDETPVITVDNKDIAVSGGNVTPSTGVNNEITATITVSLGNVSKTKEITVYGYDFYEPGIGEASYGSPRMETINDQSMIVWPASQSAAATTEIVFPEPVQLANGTSKRFTFENIWTTQTVGSQERSFKLINSAGATVLYVGYAGGSVVTNPVSENGVFTAGDGGVTVGALGAANAVNTGSFVFKTDSDGNNSVVLQYNDSDPQTVALGQNLGDIAKIQLIGGRGAPDARLLSMTNIKFANSDVAEVEIVGDSYISKVYGATAAKTYSASVFVKVEGETFTWSVADENGEPIDGVTIADGVLSVADGVTASKAVIKYASTTDELKYAVKEVTINDYAAVKSFDIEGPAAVATGDTAAYAPVNVVDEYGDTITNMPVSFALTADSSIASIDAKTGTLTTTGAGNVTVSVTVGNPGKTLTKTYDVLVAQFYYINNNVTANSVTVDVTAINNYSATTEYNVTTAKDGVQISSYTTTAANGKITVDTTGATAVEVSPIYSYTSVGDITAASPLTVPLADGRYDFTFVKGNTTRGDIYVNGVIVGNNVDQDGNGRTKASGGTWNVSDVKVSGGSAVIYMQDNTSNMSSVTFKKAPSIVTRKQHLYILGDSLVANYFGDPVSKGTDGNPAAGTAQTGWGQVLDGFIRDDINVTNLAESGNYCQGLYETVFKTVLANAEEGDVLLFECGYNDRNYPASLGSDSARYANMQN